MKPILVSAALLATAAAAVGCGAGPGARPRDVPGTFGQGLELHVGTYAVCLVEGGTPRCFAVDSSRGGYDELATRRPGALGFLPDAKLFSLTGSYGCALDPTGKVVCFGASLDGVVKPARKPFLDDGLGPPVAIAAGGDGFTNFGCVLDAEHRVDCFSDSLGPSPSHPPAELRLVQISAGKRHMCGTTPEGGAFCWGSNDFGEAGHDGFRAKAVEGLPGKVVEVVAGGGHSCARDAAGQVWCWGKNDHGQLGYGEISESSAKPRRVVGLDGAATQIALGDNHSCARLASGAVQCWGQNFGGVLGDGTDSSRPSPTTMLGIADAVRVGAGAYQTCALRKSGHVTCFGMSEVVSMTIDLTELGR